MRRAKYLSILLCLIIEVLVVYAVSAMFSYLLGFAWGVGYMRDITILVSLLYFFIRLLYWVRLIFKSAEDTIERNYLQKKNLNMKEETR